MVSTYPYPRTQGDLVPGMIASAKAGDANVRDIPSTKDSKVLATVRSGDQIMYRPGNPAPYDNDGYKWVVVESINGKSLVGWLANVVTIQPMVNEKLLARLDVPYVSQLDSQSNLYNNDCLVACSLMLIRFMFRKMGLLDPTYLTVNDMSRKTRLAGSGGDHGLNNADGLVLLRGYGFNAQTHTDLSTDKIAALIMGGRPVIALVNYKWINPKQAKNLGHYIMIFGVFGGDGGTVTRFMFHDPYLLKDNQMISVMSLDQSMTDVSTFAGITHQGLTMS